MSFQNLVQSAQQFIPNLQIKYKDESFLMKLLGTLLFFNKSFMTEYATTVGSTVYFPNQSFIKNHPISSEIILMHEIIHMYDANRLSKVLFSFLYAFPQILILLFFPLLLISWKIALISLLFALPLPAYFRMVFERRAYLTSLYTLNALGKKFAFNPNLDQQKDHFVGLFSNSSYYWMWIFNIKPQFDLATQKILNDERPFKDDIFDILDKLIMSA